MLKFEVGKKYQANGSSLVYECVFTTETSYLMRYNNPYDLEVKEVLWNKATVSMSAWKERREPVKRWFNKYIEIKTGKPFLGKFSDRGSSSIQVVGYVSKKEAENDHSEAYGIYEYLGTVEIEF